MSPLKVSGGVAVKRGGYPAVDVGGVVMEIRPLYWFLAVFDCFAATGVLCGETIRLL